MYLALWLMRRWRLPATPALSFPDAVILKRFFTPDLVFSLGISLRSASTPSSGRVDEPPWHALGQAVPKGRASSGKGSGRQGGATKGRTRRRFWLHDREAADKRGR